MRHVSIFICCFLAASCQKEVKTGDVIQKLTISNRSLVADGSSTTNVSVQLSKASTDRKKIIFTTSAGSFIGGSNTITSEAEFINGVLTASAKLKVPGSPGKIIVSAKPEFDSPIGEFQLIDSIEIGKSLPETIKLDPSSFGVASNHMNSVDLRGYLKNANGGNVSNGVKVRMNDYLMDGTASPGRFRQIQDETDDSSLVKATYSIGAFPIGTVVKIIFRVDDSTKNISDSLTLNINQ